MTNAQLHTLIGAVGAMLAFGLVSVPDGWPVWYTYGLGILNAGVAFYLGSSHPGRSGRTSRG